MGKRMHEEVISLKKRLANAWKNMRTRQSVKGVLSKLLVNAAFWIVIILLLWIAVGHAGHVKFLTPANAEPLSMNKILDFADGDLWIFQVLSGVFLQVLIRLAMKIKWSREFANDIYERVHDELASACLNFGSLFIISGFYYAFKGDVHFLITLIVGFCNVIYYSFWSEYKKESRQVCVKVEGGGEQVHAVPVHLFIGIVIAFFAGFACAKIKRSASSD